MAKLILLRHGESEWNKLNLFTGWEDVGLSEKGSAKAIFCGHDHANNSECVYKGVKFVYGDQSGWCKNYADDCLKGGTVAVFDGKDG